MLFQRRKKTKDLSDSEIIRLAKEDGFYFGELYERYFEGIFRFIYYRLGKLEEEANDLTQQTFIKAMNFLEKYEDRGLPFKSWLLRIAQNEVNQFFRAAKKQYQVDVSENKVQAMIEEILPNHELKEGQLQLLLEILNHMDQEHLDLIELRFFQELSFKEIAEIYQITEANAKMRIYRILEKLNNKWKDSYENI